MSKQYTRLRPGEKVVSLAGPDYPDVDVLGEPFMEKLLQALQGLLGELVQQYLSQSIGPIVEEYFNDLYVDLRRDIYNYITNRYTIIQQPPIPITPYQAGDGINISGNTIEVDLADTSPGLKFDSSSPGDLEVKVYTDEGLSVDSDGIQIDLATNPGLQFTSGDLDAKPNSAKAINKDADGLYVIADDTNAIKIDATAGLQAIADDTEGITIDGTEGLQLMYYTETALWIDDQNPERGLQIALSDGIKTTSGQGGGLDFVANTGHNTIAVAPVDFLYMGEE